MILTDEEIKTGIKQSAESLDIITKRIMMQMSSSIRKDLKREVDKNVLETTEDIRVYLFSVCEVLTSSITEAVIAAFKAGFSNEESLGMLIGASIRDITCEHFSKPQREVVMGAVEDLAGDKNVKHMPPFLKETQASYFFAVGRRFRQYVEDSVAIHEMSADFKEESSE